MVKTCVCFFDTAYFGVMFTILRTIVICFFFILPSSECLADDKFNVQKKIFRGQLIKWFSESNSVPEALVEPAIHDKLFLVPFCEENFKFKYAFNGKATVNAKCDQPLWQAFVRVRMSDGTFKGKVGEKTFFLFKNDFQTDHMISEADIEMTISNKFSDSLETDATSIIGKVLRKNVKQNQLIDKSMLTDPIELKVFSKDLKKYHIVTKSDIETRLLSKNKPMSLLSNSEIIGKVLKTPIKENTIVTSLLLSEASKAFVLRKDLEIGQLLDRDNVKYTTLPAELVTSAHNLRRNDIYQGKAKKFLKEGTILTKNDFAKKYSAIVAKNIISRGTRFTTQTTYRKSFWGKKPSGMIKSIEELEMHQANRTIQAGDIIRASDVKPAILVKKGDNVTLKVNNGRLEVIISVIALADGTKNQVIDLKNPDSGTLVRGKVVDERTVLSVR